jgi:hypothetical protein
MTAVVIPPEPFFARMNEQELFARIAEIKAKKCDEITRCDEAFQLIARSMREWGSVPVTREFKLKLRRCVDELYARAQERLQRHGDEESFAG